MRDFYLALKRLRALKRELLRAFRAEWARTRSEYECVGGPRCGEIVRLHGVGLTEYYTFDGVYRLGDDCRLHYRTPSEISTWQGDCWEGDLE